jgi:Tfp pilus assembly pilus retraction ATPase PilT
LERAKEGTGFLGNMLVDAGASMTQTGLDAIARVLTGGALGMQTLDACLKSLVAKGLISRENAREKAKTPENF